MKLVCFFGETFGIFAYLELDDVSIIKGCIGVHPYTDGTAPKNFYVILLILTYWRVGIRIGCVTHNA